MAQAIPRVTMIVFATSAPSGDVEEFGSTAQGFSTTTKNISVIMSGSHSEWVNGWADAIIGADNPYLESFNAVGLVFSQQLAQIFQEGVAEWDSGTTYNKGSIVKLPYTGSAINETLYVSLVDANLNNALPTTPGNNTNWRLLGLSGATDGTNAATGDVGQVQVSTQNSASGSTTVWTNLTSISLAAGTYMIFGQVIFNDNGATLTADYQMAVSQFSGTTVTDHILSDNVMGSGFSSPPSLENPATVSGWLLNLSAPGTVYLKTKATYSAGTPSNAGTIRALRIH